jgi:hypothetical protein
MSLEIALAENTAAINALAELLRNGSARAISIASGDPAAKQEKKAEAKKPEAAKQVPAPTQPTAEAPAAPEPKAETSAPALTYDQVKNQVLKVNREKGREATVALLQQFGATNAQQIPEAKWAELVEAANKVLGNG